MWTQTVTAIGVVKSPVREPLDDVWGGLRSRIELDATRFTSDALTGLDAFSHVEVVFCFSGVGNDEIHYGARHPRGRKDFPLTGIFAQRGSARPNRIGVSVCRLLGVHGLAVEVEALDAIDGTPVLDIKPYLREFAPKGEVREPEWVTELMSGYWGTIEGV